MYRSILVATDGSDRALLGLAHGIMLAKAFGAQLTALMVVDPSEIAGRADPKSGEIAPADYPAELQSYFESLRGESVAQGVEMVIRLCAGDGPAAVIEAQATEIAADLIIMTTHGHRGLRQALLGSQTLELLETTAIPVLVVR